MKTSSRIATPYALHLERPNGLAFELAPSALAKWSPGLNAANAGAPPNDTISILDPIGFDPWTGEGVTAKRIAAALRSIGADNPVTVNLNSPGGDLFEGIAIYNLLREHKGDVTVKVLGMAASAASIVAMAGDTIQIGRGAFFMIHNAWVVAMGNRNDLREFADELEPFDAAMADIYADRSGLPMKDVARMMDVETWIGGSEAVDKGFADELLPADQVIEEEDPVEALHAHAARILDVALAKAGMPRNQRRTVMNEFKSGTRDATGTGTPNAAGGVPGTDPANGTPNAAAEFMQYLKSL